MTEPINNEKKRQGKSTDERIRQLCQKKYRLCEVEELLLEEFFDVADDVSEIDDDFQVVFTGVYVKVPELGLVLRAGMGCNWDEEEQMFLPDFSLTAIYEDNGADVPIPTDYIYYEQDDFCITLSNWLNGRLSLDTIEQLWCELLIPSENLPIITADETEQGNSKP